MIIQFKNFYLVSYTAVSTRQWQTCWESTAMGNRGVSQQHNMSSNHWSLICRSRRRNNMNIASHKTPHSPCSQSTSVFPAEVALDTSILLPAKSIPCGKLTNLHSDLINLSVINFPARLKTPKSDNLYENG